MDGEVCVKYNTEQPKFNNVQIMGTKHISDVKRAIKIIIDVFSREGIFSKRDMYGALSGRIQQTHPSMNGPQKVFIVFYDGKYDEKKGMRCLSSTTEKFKDICLVGYFDGLYMMEVMKENRLYETSLAHELYHYFKLHIKDKTGHKPKRLWKRLVGYETQGKVGIINEKLKINDL